MFENNQTDSGRGGSRKGAGRKAGTANKKTREIADAAASQGITPLEYMLQVMRDDRAEHEFEDARAYSSHMVMRFEAAKAAAPYIHARLQAVELTGKDGKDLTVKLLSADADL